ncbi:NAD(P)-dependent oxidoreductase [Deferribacter abyssi]|uniref:NAD(P)-dependent oxidoreductase n=1 Tax=Deferribacter abyssi TaxID=213806 RepID=UPI003C144AA6
MIKIGFVGFGKLGAAMVENLLSHKVEIVGWNRTKEKMEKYDIIKKDLPYQIWDEGIDIVVLNLYDSESVKEVLFSEKGLFSKSIEGKIVIDTTTNHFKDVEEIADKVESSRNFYVETPIIGSVVPAKSGSLTVLAGCKKVIFDKVEHILSLFGNKVFHFEQVGVATRFKLVNNMVLGNFMAVLKEAIRVCEFMGMDRKLAIELLENGAGDSLVLRGKKLKILEKDYDPHFDVDTLIKDLECYYDLARDVGFPSIMSSMVKELYRALSITGKGDKDFSAIVDELY